MEGFVKESAPTRARSVGRRLFEAFEALGEGEGRGLGPLLAVYAEDAVFEDPYQRIEGRAAIGRAFGIFVDASRHLVLVPRDIVEDDGRVYFTWTMRFVPKVGPAIDMIGTTYAETKDGFVTYHRDTWDTFETLGRSFPFLARLGARLLRGR